MPERRADSELFLEYALRVTRHRVRMASMAAALAVIAATALAELGLLVAADHWTAGGLSAGQLLAGRWAMASTVAALGLVLIARPMFRRLNDLYVARLIERAHPEFRNDLTAALQLRRRPEMHSGILAAVEGQAARDLAKADIDSAVGRRRLIAAVAALTAVLALVLGYALLSPKSAWQSVARAFGGEAPAPTATQIVSVLPGPGERVSVGRRVAFRAEIRQPAGDAAVEISRNGGRDWLADDRLTMSAVSTAGKTQSFERPWTAGATGTGSMLFRVRCGDALSEPRELTVLSEPQLTDVRLTVEWPAYTGRPPQVVAGRRAQVLAGSAVVVRAETSVPAAQASLLFEHSPALLMRPTEGGRVLTGRMEVAAADRFRISFQDHEGNRCLSEVVYEIELVADSPPVAVHSAPASPREQMEQELRELARQDRSLLERLAERLDDLAGGPEDSAGAGQASAAPPGQAEGQPTPSSSGAAGANQGQAGQGQGENGQGASEQAQAGDNSPAAGEAGSGDGTSDNSSAGPSPASEVGPASPSPAGGDPAAGSATERGDVDDDPSDAPPAEGEPQLTTLGRLMDEAAREARKEQIDPALLADLDMTAEQFRAFVEQYQDRFDQLRRVRWPTASARVGPDTTERAGSEELISGEGPAGAIVGPADAPAGESAELTPAHRPRVSRAYRDLVDAYFRAVSEGR